MSVFLTAGSPSDRYTVHFPNWKFLILPWQSPARLRDSVHVLCLSKGITEFYRIKLFFTYTSFEKKPHLLAGPVFKCQTGHYCIPKEKRTSKLWKTPTNMFRGKVVMQFALELVDCMTRFGANDKWRFQRSVILSRTFSCVFKQVLWEKEYTGRTKFC